MDVTHFTEDDWELVRDIRLRALAYDPEVFGSSAEREIGFQERHWRMRLRGAPNFGVVVDGKAVALVGVIREPAAPVGERHVVSLWVDPQHRRRGHARAMLGAVADWAGQDGGDALSAWVVEGNEPAAAMFRACGFAETEVRVPLPRDPRLIEVRWLRRL